MRQRVRSPAASQVPHPCSALAGSPRPGLRKGPLTDVLTGTPQCRRAARSTGTFCPARAYANPLGVADSSIIVAMLAEVDPAYGWVTPHTFRKTVATRLDDAGLSARQIANHLGHAKPSMTQDVYMAPSVAAAEAAGILTRAA